MESVNKSVCKRGSIQRSVCFSVKITCTSVTKFTCLAQWLSKSRNREKSRIKSALTRRRPTIVEIEILLSVGNISPNTTGRLKKHKNWYKSRMRTRLLNSKGQLVWFSTRHIMRWFIKQARILAMKEAMETHHREFRMVEIIFQPKEAQICRGNNHLYHKDLPFKNNNKICCLHALQSTLRDLNLRVYKMEIVDKYLNFLVVLASNHRHKI